MAGTPILTLYLKLRCHLTQHPWPPLAQDTLPRHCTGLPILTLCWLHRPDPLQEALHTIVLEHLTGLSAEKLS